MTRVGATTVPAPSRERPRPAPERARTPRAEPVPALLFLPVLLVEAALAAGAVPRPPVAGALSAFAVPVALVAVVGLWRGRHVAWTAAFVVSGAAAALHLVEGLAVASGALLAAAGACALVAVALLAVRARYPAGADEHAE